MKTPGLTNPAGSRIVAGLGKNAMTINSSRQRVRRKESVEAVGAFPSASLYARHRSAIANRIRVRRRQLRLTLVEVSKRTGLDKGYLSRIERGQKLPSIATLLRVAVALSSAPLSMSTAARPHWLACSPNWVWPVAHFSLVS